MTPTIVEGSPLTLIVFPVTAGSEPNRFCQSLLLMIATEGLPGSSSVAGKARPRAGLTPNTRKKLAETLAPSTSAAEACGEPRYLEPVARKRTERIKALRVFPKEPVFGQ